MGASAWDIANLLLGLLGLAGLFQMMYTFVRAWFPAQRMKELDASITQTANLWHTVLEEGIFAHMTDFVESTRKTLHLIYIDAEDLRARTLKVRTFLQGIEAWRDGLNSDISTLLGRVQEVRALIATSTEEERKRLGAEEGEDNTANERPLGRIIAERFMRQRKPPGPHPEPIARHPTHGRYVIQDPDLLDNLRGHAQRLRDAPMPENETDVRQMHVVLGNEQLQLSFATPGEPSVPQYIPQAHLTGQDRHVAHTSGADAVEDHPDKQQAHYAALTDLVGKLHASVTGLGAVAQKNFQTRKIKEHPD